MAATGSGTNSHDDGASEVSKASEKQEATEKTSNRMQSSVDRDSREVLSERTRDERNPEKRLSKKTAGRGTFGECAIADVRTCGMNEDTSVELKNGLPEKIQTHNETWDRDAKNPRVWHVQEGNNKFDLKAEVKFKDNDLTAKVKYENGREVTYKNGEPSEISHPNGEKWTADFKNPGTWDVTAPNKDDPNHPQHTKIKDVKVNTADGDITWHVDQGVGKGHDREITQQNQYNDVKSGVSAPEQKIEAPRQLEPAREAEAANLGRAAQNAKLATPQIAEHSMKIPPQAHAEAQSQRELPVQRGALLYKTEEHLEMVNGNSDATAGSAPPIAGITTTDTPAGSAAGDSANYNVRSILKGQVAAGISQLADGKVVASADQLSDGQVVIKTEKIYNKQSAAAPLNARPQDNYQLAEQALQTLETMDGGPNSTQFKTDMKDINNILHGNVNSERPDQATFPAAWNIQDLNSSGQIEISGASRNLNLNLTDKTFARMVDSDILSPEGTVMSAAESTGAIQDQRPLYDSLSAPGDVRQGNMGDCYFMAPLSSLLQRNPNAIGIENAGIGANQQTQYAVKFPGSAEPVTVSAPTEAELNTFAGHPNGTYVAVIEKAYRQLSGARLADPGGLDITAMQLLTGQKPQFTVWRQPAQSAGESSPEAQPVYSVSENGRSANPLETSEQLEARVGQRLQDAMTNGDLASAASNNGSEPVFATSSSGVKVRVEPSHDYSIVNYEPANDSTGGMVTLRNPWGYNHPEQGKNRVQDGGYLTMPLSDFVQDFQRVTVAPCPGTSPESV